MPGSKGDMGAKGVKGDSGGREGVSNYHFICVLCIKNHDLFDFINVSSQPIENGELNLHLNCVPQEVIFFKTL